MVPSYEQRSQAINSWEQRLHSMFLRKKHVKFDQGLCSLSSYEGIRGRRKENSRTKHESIPKHKNIHEIQSLASCLSFSCLWWISMWAYLHFKKFTSKQAYLGNLANSTVSGQKKREHKVFREGFGGYLGKFWEGFGGYLEVFLTGF